MHLLSFFKRKPTAQPQPQPVVGQTALWSKSAEFDEAWKQRQAVMAGHINIPGVVADFGCGLMWLESMLPAQNGYLPIDYLRRDDRTIVLDLNRDPLPPLEANIAFCSGVLEYVQDVPRFARQLGDASFKRIIVSYCTTDHFSNLDHRRKLNWVSHESFEGLLRCFLPHFVLVALDDVNHNTIMVFDRKFA